MVKRAGSEGLAERTTAAGERVRVFGDVPVNAVSPDFVLDAGLQDGEPRAKVKIVPRRSADLGENHIGAGLWGPPCSPESEFRPYLAHHLIDGDRETIWCSRAQAVPDMEPAWIRLDLPLEQTVSRIELVPRPDGQGLPSWLVIKTSRDGRRWKTVYENRALPAGKPGRSLVVRTGAIPAKQIWIIARRCRMITKLWGADETSHGYAFVLSEVMVCDRAGHNLASVSRGTGVTVSSIDRGHGRRAAMNDMLWPLLYDIGLKWLRLSALDYVDCAETLQWHMVERQKGVYRIDPRTDAAVTEAAANGLQVCLCLYAGNRLYAPEPGGNPPEGTWWHYRDAALPLPLSEEGQAAYRDYAAFMVRHFRGRVRYYEIWNEPEAPTYWPAGVAPDARRFCDLVKLVSPAIRREDPDAKIILGSSYLPRTPASWLNVCLDSGIAGCVDVIAWHPFYDADPGSDAYRAYPEAVAAFKRHAREMGFRGEFMATEILWSAPYPGTLKSRHTELQKAKNMARCFVMHLHLEVSPFWCEAWQTYAVTMTPLDNPSCAWDVGLLRNGFSGSPEDPVTVQPAYYVLRTLCTVMENAVPAAVEVDLGYAAARIEHYAFRRGGEEVLVALFLCGESSDRCPGLKTDVVLRGAGAHLIGVVDTLNGTEQQVAWVRRGEAIEIPGLIVRDYPLFVRLSRKVPDHG